MSNNVPQLSIIFMGIVALMGIAIPILLFIYFRKKHNAEIMPFFIGVAVFIVFALIIEGTINFAIFSSPVAYKIKENTWLFGIFGGLMAGVFEETGRFAAFKTVLKKKLHNDKNALMYGAGHSGIEVFLILTISMITNLVFSIMFNMGMLDKLISQISDPAKLSAINTIIETLVKTNPSLFWLSVAERFAAIGMQIALSILVWYSVKNIKKLWLFPLAIFIHAFIDAVLVILKGFGANLGVIFVALYAMTILTIGFSTIIWRKNVSIIKGEGLIKYE